MVLQDMPKIYKGTATVDKIYSGDKLIWVPEILPEGYTKCLCLDNGSYDNPRYIDTGINKDYKAMIDIQFYETQTRRALMGSRASASYYFGADLNNKFEMGDAKIRDEEINTTDRHKVYLDKHWGETYTDCFLNMTVENVTITRSCSSKTFETFCLFTIRGISYYISRMKIFRVKFFKDDSLVRDYIPCTDANGNACFYELVEGTTEYGESGTPFQAIAL